MAADGLATEIYSFMVLLAGSPKSGCQQGPAPLKALEGRAVFQRSDVPWHIRLVSASVSRGLPLLSLCTCIFPVHHLFCCVLFFWLHGGFQDLSS